MEAKEYLSQAYKLDQQIDAKLEMMYKLMCLATKRTSILSDMPRRPSGNKQTMADTVDKIIDLNNEINAEIDKLVDLKKQIKDTIQTLDNADYKILLTKRYLCNYTWEQVANSMGYSIQHVKFLARRAIKEIEKVLEVKTA